MMVMVVVVVVVVVLTVLETKSIQLQILFLSQLLGQLSTFLLMVMAMITVVVMTPVVVVVVVVGVVTAAVHLRRRGRKPRMGTAPPLPQTQIQAQDADDREQTAHPAHSQARIRTEPNWVLTFPKRVFGFRAERDWWVEKRGLLSRVVFIWSGACRCPRW